MHKKRKKHKRNTMNRNSHKHGRYSSNHINVFSTASRTNGHNLRAYEPIILQFSNSEIQHGSHRVKIKILAGLA